MKRKVSGKRIKDKLAPYLFIFPFFISYICFFLFPAAYSLVLSFYRYKGFGKATFVKFENYIQLFKYPTMWNSLKNTFIYFIFSYIIVMVLSFLLAVIVRSKPVSRYQNIYKPLIFLPQVCAVVASALVFKVIFGNRVGVINQLFGISIPFLNNTNYMKIPVISLISWRNTGWYFIIFLSGLTTISDEILEAAKIDGTSPFQSVYYIIMPMMKPIFTMTSITYVIGALKLYTEPNLLLSNNEAPIQVAPFINIITSNINSGMFGKACAAGWILTTIIILITLLQMRLFKEDY